MTARPAPNAFRTRSPAPGRSPLIALSLIVSILYCPNVAWIARPVSVTRPILGAEPAHHSLSGAALSGPDGSSSGEADGVD